MRHAKQSQRLSLPGDRREALVHGLVRSLVVHGQIRTTYARAKEAQRLADRLVTLGKEGNLHARRRAFRILQSRTLVKQLFAEIAPRYVDISGGYTRVLRLGLRRGDGAEVALLALSRLPAPHPAPAAGPAAAQAPQGPAAPKRQPAKDADQEKAKPKGLLEGLRNFWTKKKKGAAAP
jgi:large subunit ribosomal protein L17